MSVQSLNYYILVEARGIEPRSYHKSNKYSFHRLLLLPSHWSCRYVSDITPAAGGMALAKARYKNTVVYM